MKLTQIIMCTKESFHYYYNIVFMKSFRINSDATDL